MNNPVNRRFSSNVVLGFLAGCLVVGNGCHAVKVTEPKRSATEQLLLSTATDRAVANLDLTPLRGRTIYVEERYFKSYDRGYALGAIRQRLAESGALLTRVRDQAEVVVEVRSGGLSMDTQETLLGIPALAMPVPLAGSLETPELALYKDGKADSIAKFALFAYDRNSGAHTLSAGPASGTAHMNHYKLLGFISWRRTDLPKPESQKR